MFNIIHKLYFFNSSIKQISAAWSSDLPISAVAKMDKNQSHKNCEMTETIPNIFRRSTVLSKQAPHVWFIKPRKP